MTKEDYIKKIQKICFFYPIESHKLDALTFNELKEMTNIIYLKIAIASINFK
jgi:hypothetical protein